MAHLMWDTWDVLVSGCLLCTCQPSLQLSPGILEFATFFLFFYWPEFATLAEVKQEEEKLNHCSHSISAWFLFKSKLYSDIPWHPVTNRSSIKIYIARIANASVTFNCHVTMRWVSINVFNCLKCQNFPRSHCSAANNRQGKYTFPLGSPPQLCDLKE